MRVQIAADTSIPPGYTYTRCDTYTAEELLAASTPGFYRGTIKNRRVNLNAAQYIASHPKEQYTSEDLYRIREMKPLRMGRADMALLPAAEQGCKQKRGKPKMLTRDPDVRTGDILPGDLRLPEAGERFGVSYGMMSMFVKQGGMPFRIMPPEESPNHRKCYFVRLPEVREYLEKLPRRTAAQDKILRKLRSDTDGLQNVGQ